MLPSEARADLISRLRKIEGQAQGIQRMLEDGRDCRDVIYQLASVREATKRASVLLMRHHMRACLTARPESSKETVDDMIKLLLRI